MNLRKGHQPERSYLLMGTRIYICILRKRCVSVSPATLKTLAAERVYP